MARSDISKFSKLLVRARSIVARSSRLLNSPYRSGDLSPREIGDLGEKIAATYLRARGWSVLMKNFRAPKGGEVDLICRGGPDLDLLVFVEVKTRTRRDFGRPLRAVNAAKQALILKGAYEYLGHIGREFRSPDRQDIRCTFSWRFDVVEIILEDGKRPDINLVENAF